jgi:hypothetical protein
MMLIGVHDFYRSLVPAGSWGWPLMGGSLTLLVEMSELVQWFGQ